MAIVNAANAGNWSTAATWPGSVYPVPGDVVYANGKAIVIDQDITVASINTTQGTGGVAGGSFTLNTGRTVNAHVNAGTTSCLLCSVASGVFVVNGNITASNSGSLVGLAMSATNGILTVTGNIQGGNGGGNAAGMTCSGAGSVTTVTGNVAPGVGEGIVSSSTAVLTVNGNVSGGGAAGHGIAHSGTALLTVNGDLTGGSATSNGVSMSASTGPVIVNGNLIGSATGTGLSGAMLIDRSAVVTINGNVTGGGVLNKSGLYFGGGASTVTVNGNLTAGVGSHASYHNSSGGATVLIVNGSITATAAGNGVHSVNAEHTLRARGPFVQGDNGRAPFDISIFQLIRTTATDNNITLWDHTNSTTIVFNTPDFATDLPADDDVRDGIAFGGTHTGSLKVPDPTQVAVGVETDDTVGSAVLNPEDVWDFLRADAVTSGSMGERLKNAATVSTTGDQIAAAG